MNNNKRLSIIKNQLLTIGINDYNLLNALYKVDRKDFVKDSKFYKELSYSDEEVFINDSNILMSLSVIAKMLDCVKIKKSDNILDINIMSGYTTIIMSLLGNSVYGVVDNADMASIARKNILNYNIENAIIVNIEKINNGDNLGDQCYDVIFCNGIINELPNSIKEKLNHKNGRIVCFSTDINELLYITLYMFNEKGQLIKQKLHNINSQLKKII